MSTETTRARLTKADAARPYDYIDAGDIAIAESAGVFTIEKNENGFSTYDAVEIADFAAAVEAGLTSDDYKAYANGTWANEVAVRPYYAQPNPVKTDPIFRADSETADTIEDLQVSTPPKEDSVIAFQPVTKKDWGAKIAGAVAGLAAAFVGILSLKSEKPYVIEVDQRVKDAVAVSAGNKSNTLPDGVLSIEEDTLDQLHSSVELDDLEIPSFDTVDALDASDTPDIVNDDTFKPVVEDAEIAFDTVSPMSAPSYSEVSVEEPDTAIVVPDLSPSDAVTSVDPVRESAANFIRPVTEKEFHRLQLAKEWAETEQSIASLSDAIHNVVISPNHSILINHGDAIPGIANASDFNGSQFVDTTGHSSSQASSSQETDYAFAVTSEKGRTYQVAGETSTVVTPTGATPYTPPVNFEPKADDRGFFASANAGVFNMFSPDGSSLDHFSTSSLRAGYKGYGSTYMNFETGVGVYSSDSDFFGQVGLDDTTLSVVSESVNGNSVEFGAEIIRLNSIGAGSFNGWTPSDPMGSVAGNRLNSRLLTDTGLSSTAGLFLERIVLGDNHKTTYNISGYVPVDLGDRDRAQNNLPGDFDYAFEGNITREWDLGEDRATLGAGARYTAYSGSYASGQRTRSETLSYTDEGRDPVTGHLLDASDYAPFNGITPTSRPYNGPFGEVQFDLTRSVTQQFNFARDDEFAGYIGAHYEDNNAFGGSNRVDYRALAGGTTARGGNPDMSGVSGGLSATYNWMNASDKFIPTVTGTLEGSTIGPENMTAAGILFGLHSKELSDNFQFNAQGGAVWDSVTEEVTPQFFLGGRLEF